MNINPEHENNIKEPQNKNTENNDSEIIKAIILNLFKQRD